MCHFITCSSQKFIFLFSIKIVIDHFLWMFHTKSDRKRFRFHINTTSVKHIKRIPGTMSQCKHTGICRYLFFIIDFNCSQMTVFDAKICHLCFKAKRTSQKKSVMFTKSSRGFHDFAMFTRYSFTCTKEPFLM